MPKGRITRKREVRSCQKCQTSKLGCDRARPQCKRCAQHGFDCSYLVHSTKEIQTRVSPAPEIEQLETGENTMCQTAKAFTPEKSNETLSTFHSNKSDRDDEAVPPTHNGISFAEQTPERRDHRNHEGGMIQKRNRGSISCARCQRLKVRCDRKLPCHRCVQNKRVNECTYKTTSKHGNIHRSMSVPVRNLGRPGALDTPWNLRFRNETHWAILLQDIEAFLSPVQCPYKTTDSGDEEHASPGYISLSPNYPLGGLVNNNTTSQSILKQVPPRFITDLFINKYLDIIERTHRILHVQSFKEELQNFWENPDAADDGWLAQLFTIIALGCQVYNAEATHLGETTYEELPAIFLQGAEVCLKRTPFMFRTSLANIRTLCLMVVAKQINTMSCHESDTCWPLTGLIVRLAMGMGIHSISTNSSHYSPLEGEMRRGLWITITYMELRQSLISGMPLLLQSSDFACPFSTNISEDEQSQSVDGVLINQDLSKKSDASLHAILSYTLPTALRVVKLANSTSCKLSYDQVLEYNFEMRQLLNKSNSILPALEPLRYSHERPDIQDLERIILDIFFRRILLALHRPFALKPQALFEYPESYWSSLECSLALLACQRYLCEHPTGQHSISWFAGLFKQDFFTAAMTVCLHLLRRDLSLEIPSDDCSHMQPRETVLETLRSCRDIWCREKDRSFCHSKAFSIIDTVVCALQE